MKLKVDIRRVLKGNSLYILILLSLTLFTRLILIMNAPFIYFFDSYGYMKNAIDLFSPGTIKLSSGMPFVIALGALFSIFENAFGAVLVSRLFVVLISAFLVYVIYCLGLRMASKTFAFLAALLAIFEPYFLSYSIVPHNDVFVAAMGLAAFYFATSDKKYHLILSLIFFYLAVFTRTEYYPVLLIPILIFCFYRSLKTRSRKAFLAFISVFVVCVLPSIWAYNTAVAVTRFSIVEKFSLFLTPQLVKQTLDLSFQFYDQQLLNQSICIFVGLGMALGILNILAQSIRLEKGEKTFAIRFKKRARLAEKFLSDNVMIAFCLLLVFVIYIIVLTVYGTGYIIVDGKLMITGSIGERYLILPRLLMGFPLAYILALVIKEVHGEIVHQN